MFAATLFVVLVGAVTIGVVLARDHRRDAARIRFLRWIGLALAVVPGVLLAPLAIADSGAAASYLLGVPVVAAALPLLAEIAHHAVLIATTTALAAIVILAWAVVTALGLGQAYLPAALALVVATVVQLRAGRIRPV
jgi:hypothetical protein